MVHPPNEREFLSAVLERIQGLPKGFGERLARLIEEGPEDRAEAIRKLIVETTRD